MIPNGYRGEIVIFFEEPCGREPIYENGRRLYTLSNAGHLITKFKVNRGYFDREFFFVDEQGSRSKIPEFHWQNFETETKEWNLYRQTPVEEFTKETVGAFWAYGSETYVISQKSFAYLIWSYNDFEREQQVLRNERKASSERADLYLHACREIGESP